MTAVDYTGSRAITIAQGSQEELAIVVAETKAGQNDNSYYSHVCKLGGILIKHENLTDTLSKDLYRLGGEFFACVVSVQQPTEETIRKRFDKLVATLETPFGMLREPWILNDLVWDKCVWDRYFSSINTLNKVNCVFEDFRDLPSLPQIYPHEFAADMIGWIKELKPFAQPLLVLKAKESEVNELGITLLRGPQNVVKEPVQILQALNNAKYIEIDTARKEIEKYSQIIKLVMEERKTLKFTEELAIRTQELELELEEMDKQQELDLVRLEHSCRQHTEDLRKSLITIKDEYQSSLNIHKQISEELTLKVGELHHDLVDAKVEISSQKSTISSLIYQVQNLAAQVNWLNNEVNNNDGGCIIC